MSHQEKPFSKIKQRESGIELLRIIAVLMVIAVHYFGGEEGILQQPFSLSLNNVASRILESMCIICVNLFVIITGYFGINKKGINIRRILDIILLVAFWGVLFHCLSPLWGENITLFDTIQSAFPYLFGSIWYVRVYLILTILSPFLNKLFTSLNKTEYTYYIIIAMILFSVLPSFVPAFKNDNGYDIIHFVLIYSIGGYIRLHLNKKPKIFVCFLLYLLCSAVTTVFSVYGNGLGYWGYDFISVVLSCVFLFLAFSQMHFKSKMINYIASTTFGVYIIEGVLPLAYKYFGIRSDYFDSKFFLVHFAWSVFSIFLVAVVFEIIRKFLFKISIDKLFDKIPVVNKRILTFDDDNK